MTQVESQSLIFNRRITWTDYIPSIVVATLFVLTYFSLPKVDYIEPSPFFYVKLLPPLYFALVIASIIGAVMSKNHFGRVFCTITFVLALHFTPNIVLVNPWHFDSYAFLAEAVYVKRNGYIADIAYWSLLESPGIGLVFGPFLSVTGIDPFAFLKIYQALLPILMTLLIYSIVEKFTSNRSNASLAPLLTMSIMWVNEFFLNRQSFSLIFYLSSWLLLSKIIVKKFELKTVLLLGTQIFAMIISHPATPLFFMTNLICIIVLSKIFKVFESWETKTVLSVIWFSAFGWLLWNYSVAQNRSLIVFSRIIDTVLTSLLSRPTILETYETKVLTGFTSNYKLIIYLRLITLFVVVALSVTAPLLIYWRNRGSKVAKSSILLMGWVVSNFASALPLLAAGLPYFERPGLFTFISWGPMAVLIYENLWKKEPTRSWRAIRSASIIIILLVPSLLIPVTKYAPLPYLYPTSRELDVMQFSNSLYSSSYPIILLEYTSIYTFNYLYEIHRPSQQLIQLLSTFESIENLSRITGSRSFIVIYRLITRDGFRVNSPSMYDLVVNVTKFSESSHNKVYDSGWPYSILVPAR